MPWLEKMGMRKSGQGQRGRRKQEGDKVSTPRENGTSENSRNTSPPAGTQASGGDGGHRDCGCDEQAVESHRSGSAWSSAASWSLMSP